MVMFGVFAFTFALVVVILRKTRELILQQFTPPLLSDHLNAVFRSNFLPLRELIERSNCQEVQSRGIDNSLRFFF